MKKLVLILIVALSSSLNSGASYADECDASSSTVELKDCVFKTYQKADKDLNQTYQRLLAKLTDTTHKKVLKTAQLAWLKYRDAHCEYEAYLNRGGTVYSVYYTSCLSHLTEERSQLLKASLQDHS